MASNHFGTIFKITTWGESHGKAIGVIIDGCPAGLEISEEDITEALSARAPGNSPFTSPRKEPDRAEILSGVFEGRTTGAPISILIANRDVDSSSYEPVKHLLRPGHANASYLEKYGIFDYRGGGRASGRETACRVAAGAIARKLLNYYKIDLTAYILQIGTTKAEIPDMNLNDLRHAVKHNPLFCPDPIASQLMAKNLLSTKEEGDSLGGIVEFKVEPMLSGLGDPVYEKLEANLAKAMLGLPATKGFEIGAGFKSAAMKGSESNDLFISKQEKKLLTKTNHSGGTLGGISTGMPLLARVVFKPTSSIRKNQETLNLEGEKAIFNVGEKGRHDPCLAIRAVPVVEAMAALVLADALLLNKCATL